ncbi:MAG: class I adenylate-forming enzyme family protein [Alphaproteobacteria bacterium]
MAAIRAEAHYGRVMSCYAERPPHMMAVLADAVARAPDHVALVDGAWRLTYAALDAESARIAGNLAARGIGQGDRVAMLIGNSLEFFTVLLACARMGAIAVPMGIRLRKPEIAFICSQSGARMLIHAADLAAELPDAADAPALEARIAVGSAEFEALRREGATAPKVEIGEEDTFCILYTSGTTGRPKGAMLTHLGMVHTCIHWRERLSLREGAEVALLPIPITHVSGLGGMWAPVLFMRGTLVLVQTFKARAFLELAQREGCTYALMVPAMYNLCLLEPDVASFDLKSWRLALYGGAPMPEPTIKRLAELTPHLQLVNAYGATETTSPTTITPPGKGVSHADSIGTVVDCGEIRVMDEKGREVAPGQTGELWIAGPMVVPGYWRNETANAAAFTGGFWKSGDIGAVDAEGFVRLYDRKKDMISRGGYKIYPAEVESVLTEHPDVIECAIVGQACPVLGERVHAFVVTKSGTLDASDIRTFCAPRMADYKVPEFVTVLPDALPRNANGKMQKDALRKLLPA